MGSWFSNLHVRKNSILTETDVIAYIRKIMTAQQYMPVESEDEADGAYAIISDNKSHWFSVYSDLFSFDDANQFDEYATPMSAELKTDILGISCFDSDFLYLNLIDAESKIDAWAGVGCSTGLGIQRRNNLSAWKNKVDDYSNFKEHIKKKFVFAEDVLAHIESCIHLPKEYGTASYEYLSDLGVKEQLTFLYFKLPESTRTQDAPKGLSVYFVGPYVEHDDITFSDVCFVKHKNNQTESIPIELKKVQLSDGQWAYYYHDPGYKIPSKVDERLPMMKRMRLESEHSIIIRFVPHGNPRKILDITVVLVPDKNPQGQTGWNVWHHFGSKEAFIKFHNDNWSKLPNCEHLLLREEDFD